MVAGATIEVTGRWSAGSAVAGRWSAGSAVAGRWSAGSAVAGRAAGTALALHSRWARGSGVRDARPESDARDTQYTAEHRCRS
jgi:hypothetical protein